MSKTYNIAVIPGDGTGPEVVREGRKVLTATAAKFGFKINYQEFDFGGERYIKTGEVLPNQQQIILKNLIQYFLELSDIGC